MKAKLFIILLTVLFIVPMSNASTEKKHAASIITNVYVITIPSLVLL